MYFEFFCYYLCCSIQVQGFYFSSNQQGWKKFFLAFWHVNLIEAIFVLQNIERHTRSIDEMEIVTEKQIEESTERLVDDGTCLGSNPCGWGAYDERTKKIIYYIANK